MGWDPTIGSELGMITRYLAFITTLESVAVMELQSLTFL